jgi:hypothetical protein
VRHVLLEDRANCALFDGTLHVALTAITGVVMPQLMAGSALVGCRPDMARRLLTRSLGFGKVARLGCRTAVSNGFKPWNGNHPDGRKIMASRQEQQPSSWQTSGTPRFLWTDYGAMISLIAVTGFTLYRAWF